MLVCIVITEVWNVTLVGVFGHRETRRMGVNPEECVVTFCGNSEPQNRKSLIEKMERAKGFEPSTFTLAT